MTYINIIKCLCILVIVFNRISSLTNDYILKESNNHHEHKGYQLVDKISPISTKIDNFYTINNTYVHEIIISIKQNNIEYLTELLYNISDINSNDYGKFLSFDEIGSLVSNQNATSVVIKWLNAYNITSMIVSQFGEYVTVKESIHVLEKLFKTQFYEFKPVKNDTNVIINDQLRIVRASSYSIPKYLDQHIHEVFRLVNLPPTVKFQSKLQKLDEYIDSRFSDKITDFIKSNVIDQIASTTDKLMGKHIIDTVTSTNYSHAEIGGEFDAIIDLYIDNCVNQAVEAYLEPFKEKSDVLSLRNIMHKHIDKSELRKSIRIELVSTYTTYSKLAAYYHIDNKGYHYGKDIL